MKPNLIFTFWLALIIAIIGTFFTSIALMNQWSRYVSFSEIEGRPSYRIQSLVREIESTLNKNGNLEAILLESQISEFGDIYLLNSLGVDVLGRTLPTEILNLDSRSSSQQPVLTRRIETDDKKLYSLIFHFNSPAPIWTLFKRFGLYIVLLAALVISSFIAWFLAAKTVRPIQDIALASNLQGEGDFLTKIDKKIIQRQDEIGELARQLQLSGMKIHELLKKQKEFLRDVSHEVRTPLARLQLATETLQLDTNDERSLEQIKSEVTIINQLVQDLLHLSHFDRPANSQKIENISLSDVICDLIDRSQILAQSKNIVIKVQGKKWQNINLKVVRLLIDRALDNLISNAVRHSPKNSEICLRCSVCDDHCHIDILDQGNGVSDSDLKNIFEPFFRVDSSRNRQTGGFGLGLSLVKQIAEFHKGKVVALSHNEGFMVKLTLPIYKV